MTRVVYKIPLPLAGSINSYPMFKRSEDLPIVSVDWQYHVPTAWFETVHDETPNAFLEIYTIGTGWDIPPETRHVGTLIDPGGFVWHYYAKWR